MSPNTIAQGLVYPAVDLALARRLERAEGSANAAYVEARRELQPDAGLGRRVQGEDLHPAAEWIEVAGLYAMYDGPASPLTQTFGLGLFEPFLAPEFDQVEAFFRKRGVPTAHETSALVARETLSLLSSRGYSPIEASTVLVRPSVLTSASAPSAITVRLVEGAEAGLWSRVAAQGWSSESEELAAFVEDFGAVVARTRGVSCFLAELDDQPIAAAALNIAHDVALLAGASTIPAARRRGAQQALLEARLRYAAGRGIGLAMIVTQPGSASQRNAERQGFRPVYTRAKWQLDAARGQRA